MAEENQEIKQPQELFHQGVVTKLFPSNNMGLVRTESGREVQFSFEFVILLGGAQKPGDLREGMEVGYDLGWTSKGLRITKIKVGPQPAAPKVEPDLKGDEGQGQNLPSQDLPDKDS